MGTTSKVPQRDTANAIGVVSKLQMVTMVAMSLPRLFPAFCMAASPFIGDTS
jgi:hypothetical protein